MEVPDRLVTVKQLVPNRINFRLASKLNSRANQPVWTLTYFFEYTIYVLSGPNM